MATGYGILPYTLLRATRRARGVAEAEMKQKRNRDENWAPAETRAELRQREQRPETRPETRAERAEHRQRRDAERRQRRKLRAGRDEIRLETETQSESENTNNDSQKCSSSCGALCYIERAQRLPWCCKWRVISTNTPTSAVRGVHLAPLASLTLAAHARYCIRRARVTTPPTHLY